jgi:hypothetical protein
VIFLSFIGLQHLEDAVFQYDSDLGYRHQVHTLQSAVDYVSKVSKPGQTVNGNFPAYYAVGFKHGGYLKNKTMNAQLVPKLDVDYYLLSDPGDFTDIKGGRYELTLLKSYKEGFAEVKIYRSAYKHEGVVF